MNTSEADATLHRSLADELFAARRNFREPARPTPAALCRPSARTRLSNTAIHRIGAEAENELTGEFDVHAATRIGIVQRGGNVSRVLHDEEIEKSVRRDRAVHAQSQYVSRFNLTARKLRTPPRPPWWAVAAALTAVAGLMWWMMAQRLPAIDPRHVIETNLAAAQLAIRDGRTIEPPEHSAVHYYSTVLALDPANESALAGLERIADLFVEDAKHSILSGRFADAVDAIEYARRARADDRRLRHLETQLTEALQDHVSAMSAGAPAQEISPDESQSAQQSSLASQAAQPGRGAEPATLPAPATSSTSGQLDYAARLEDARRKSVAAVNDAIERGELRLARERIEEARRLGVAKEALATPLEALQAAERTEHRAGLLRLVLQRSAEGRLLEPPHDNARHYLAQLAQVAPSFAGLQQGIEVLGSKLVANARIAIHEQDFALAVRLLSQASEIEFDQAQIGKIDDELRIARAAAETVHVEAPAASNIEPKLIGIVEPDYPRAARVRNLEGWVDLNLFVTPDGKVADAHVLRREGSKSFERAALAAVRQWQYEPMALSDPNARQSVEVRVAFRLEE